MEHVILTLVLPCGLDCASTALPSWGTANVLHPCVPAADLLFHDTVDLLLLDRCQTPQCAAFRPRCRDRPVAIGRVFGDEPLIKDRPVVYCAS